MINRLLRGSNKKEIGSVLKLSSTKTYDIAEAYKVHDGADLPKAPSNPYKKRPVKLKYDLNEYH